MNKSLLFSPAGLALLLVSATAAQAQTHVGVSVTVRQPGVYGRIDIGGGPPAVVYPQPVIITPPRVVVERSPVYLYVPPGHQKNWSRYCSRYAACGQPVYFVREEWVRERYEHEHPRDQGRGHGGRRDDHNDDRHRGRGHDKHGR
jgi:hypothetical protein